MSAFEERMKKLAVNLTPEAKEIVRKVLAAEHQTRFSDRSKLPEDFANAALQLAKRKESSK
jgi:hypothetical protein